MALFEAMSTHPARPGRNDPCWCGSGKKFKKCHYSEYRALTREERKERPALNEEDLIVGLKSGKEQLRDPRELATVLVKSGKPVLIVDEKRIDSPGTPFVFFSVVALPAAIAFNALHSISDICRLHHIAAKFSGPKLVRSERADAATLRTELEAHLSKAQVLRAGITYESLRTWRDERGWPGITTVPSGIVIKKPEYAVLQTLSLHCVALLDLSGFVLMVVDRSVQNGLDPQLHRLSEGELGAVAFDLDSTGCLMEIFGSTPEDPTAGAWIRLPDYDAARASISPRFEQFADRVHRAPVDGTLIYWNHSFQRWPQDNSSAHTGQPELPGLD